MDGGDQAMRTMVLLRTEGARTLSGPDAFGPGGIEAFDASLTRAGVLLASHGPDRDGDVARVRIGRGRATVRVGETTAKDGVLAGLWLWQVHSIDEAVAWATRFPADPADQIEFEIRPVADRAARLDDVRADLQED
jgi:hypothetical protein